MSLFSFIKDFFSVDSSPKSNQLKNYLRFTLFLFLIFILVFSTSFVYFLREKKTYQLIDLRGRDLITAIKWLQEHSLKVKLFEKIETGMPKYTVISHDPSPGEMVKEGRTVSIVVNAVNQFVFMPNLVSNRFDQARKNIYSMFSGYKTVPKVVKVESFSILPEDLVVDQFPKVGEVLSSDQEILLVVSQGLVDQAIEIGNYRYQNFREVESNLIQQGIKVRARYYLTDKKRRTGKIFKQDIPSGEQLVPGETIRFEVGVFSDRPTDPSELNSLEMLRIYSLQVPFRSTDFKQDPLVLEKIKEQLKEGLLSKESNRLPMRLDLDSESEENPLIERLRQVKLVVRDAIGMHVALEEEIPSGETVDLPYKIVGNGILQVYLDGDLWDTVKF